MTDLRSKPGTSELVMRLRNYIPGENDDWVAIRITEAADRIEELEAALRQARARVDYLGLVCTNPRHFEENNKTFLPEIDAAINREPVK